jgi:hypothetical protein
MKGFSEKLSAGFLLILPITVTLTQFDSEFSISPFTPVR